MIKNGSSLCYKFDLQQLLLAETLRQAQKREIELEWEAPTS